MKRGSYTGIAGIPNQDIAMWETMGPIANRSHERLGASDVAIVQFRRHMLAAVRAFVNGDVPLGLGQPHVPHAKLRSFEGIVPKTVDWRTLGPGRRFGRFARRFGLTHSERQAGCAPLKAT